MAMSPDAAITQKSQDLRKKSAISRTHAPSAKGWKSDHARFVLRRQQPGHQAGEEAVAENRSAAPWEPPSRPSTARRARWYGKRIHCLRSASSGTTSDERDS